MNFKRALVEIIVLVVLVLFGILGIIFLFTSKMATRERELQIHKMVVELEVKNSIERATAALLTKLRQEPFSTSFNVFSPHDSPSQVASLLAQYNLETHYKEDMYLYTYIDVIDSSSKINILQDEKSFYTMLANLIKVTKNDTLWKVFELKTSGRITTLSSLLEFFKYEHKKIIKDFFCVDSFSTDKIIAPIPLEERNVAHAINDNIYSLSDLIPKNTKFLKKSYININTAKFEVIYSLLNEISGIYLSEQTSDIPWSEEDNLT
ncbi:MAG: hypothetical protein ACK4NF_00215, partial [Planctomycetota bacterium]